MCAGGMCARVYVCVCVYVCVNNTIRFIHIRCWSVSLLCLLAQLTKHTHCVGLSLALSLGLTFAQIQIPRALSLALWRFGLAFFCGGGRSEELLQSLPCSAPRWPLTTVTSKDTTSHTQTHTRAHTHTHENGVIVWLHIRQKLW